ncbi:hypothetical protein X750_31645 [Mesorhizobium sp. LNJC394B00]|nr:hypothetical protein X750_31645 [Mesorhizobium sp. LNJC394B00]
MAIMENDVERLRIRQELYELYFSGVNSLACAPMPGTFFELLELGALARHEPVPEGAEPAAAAKDLTVSADGPCMSTSPARFGRALLNVAYRIREHSNRRVRV